MSTTADRNRWIKIEVLVMSAFFIVPIEKFAAIILFLILVFLINFVKSNG